MALHRDIRWIGRQWAVTGHGMQTIDPKLGGKFDIAISGLWDDDAIERLREQQWFNVDDFERGLAIARARYPAPPGRIIEPRPPKQNLPPAESASSVPPLPPLSKPAETPDRKVASADPPPGIASEKPAPPEPAPAEVPKPPPPAFEMRLPGCRARFISPWRARFRR